MAATEKKLVKSKSGYRMVPVIDTHTSPFTISEPAWVPDTQASLLNEIMSLIVTEYCECPLQGIHLLKYTHRFQVPNVL